MFKKILAIALAVLMCATMVVAFASCKKDEETEKKGMGADILPRNTVTKSEGVTIPDDFKIGLICLHDENSTYDKNFIDAFKSVVKALGIPNDRVFIKTGIGEDTTCEDAARELAGEKGCKIVFADSFGHEQFLKKVAPEYPNVEFCHATGTSAKTAGIENLHNAFASIYEGRYLAGIVAGMKLNEMISNGKIKAEEAVIGYVGAFTYAEVVSGMTSFYLGAKSVCPSATMKVRYTGSWYDQGKEQEAATALIEKDGCVLISQHADSLGAPTACEQKGVPNVSYNGSTYAAGENTFMVSSAINWAPYFKYIIETVCKNEKIDADWCGDIAVNSVVLTGLNLDVVAEGTEAKVKEAIAAFKAGTLHVFDTSKFTVTVTETANVNAKVDANGHLTEYLADVDGDYKGDTNVVRNGYFDESNAKDFRSAPYFDIIIDGITNLNTNYGD